MSIYRDRQTGLWTRVFYVLPDAPRIAQDADGNPAFDFLWFRGQAGESSVKAGGIVTLTVDLSLTEEERETLAGRARCGLWIRIGRTRVELRSMPFKSGMVKLTYAAESGGGRIYPCDCRFRPSPPGWFPARHVRSRSQCRRRCPAVGRAREAD